MDSGPGGYRLVTPADEVDLFRFERLVGEGSRALDSGDAETAAGTLRAALALWRGPAFADLPDRESAAARPEALRTTALYRRIEADLALGRAVEVVPELRELVAGDPLHEPFQAQLIRALSAAGRPADALTAYEDARRAIADRLGSRPGTELAGLHARLLRGDRPADARRGAADGRNGTGTPYGPPWGALDVPPAPGPAPGPASGVTADGGSPTRELRAPGIPAVGDRPPHDAPNAGSAPVSAPAPGAGTPAPDGRPRSAPADGGPDHGAGSGHGAGPGHGGGPEHGDRPGLGGGPGDDGPAVSPPRTAGAGTAGPHSAAARAAGPPAAETPAAPAPTGDEPRQHEPRPHEPWQGEPRTDEPRTGVPAGGVPANGMPLSGATSNGTPPNGVTSNGAPPGDSTGTPPAGTHPARTDEPASPGRPGGSLPPSGPGASPPSGPGASPPSGPGASPSSGPGAPPRTGPAPRPARAR
ncbi:BTAD domain-containing putative transcriptional regulator [Streptomyces pactum]|uniref:BTAD domain-containing putative transcriptional regulator n=1 Tax=Streptomyces pactum TaxID=68249 RepID=UPI003556A9FD